MMDEKKKITAEEEAINQWLTSVHFRRSFRGVDENDVWKKLEELNALYEKLLLAQRAQYELRIQQLEREVAGHG